MSTPYSHRKTMRQGMEGFDPFFSIDPNRGYSMHQRRLVDDSQALYYETALGKGIIDSLARYVIGQGLKPMASPETSILGWDAETADRFRRQAESYWRITTGGTDFDWHGKRNLSQLQQTAFKTALIQGDFLLHRGYRKTSDGTVAPYVQIIPGRFVRSPDGMDTKDTVGGVRIAPETGKEIGYWVAETDSSLNDACTEKFVRRFNHDGFMEFDLVRLRCPDPMMVRGVPLLDTVKYDILRIEKLNDTRLTKALVQSLFTVAVTHAKDNGGQLTLKDKLMAQMDTEESEASGENSFRLEPGICIDLNEGEDAKLFESQTNAEDFSKLIRTYTEQILTGTDGLSYELLQNSYNASYSASRATINGGEKAFQIYRDEFVTLFLRPIWEQVVSLGILDGSIDAPGWEKGGIWRRAILATTWAGVTPIQVDPVKDITAYITAIGGGIATREMACRNLFGTDFEEVAERLRAEASAMEEGNG